MFANLFNAVSKHKRFVLPAFLLFIALTSAGTLFLNYSNDLSVMLPSGGEINRYLSFYRKSNLTNNIVISLELNSGEYNTTDLLKEADDLSRSIDSPLISEVRTGAEKGNIKDTYKALWDNLPAFFNEENVKYLREETKPLAIKKRVDEMYKTLLKPGGSVGSYFLKTDPFGLTHNLLKKIRRFSTSTTYRTTLKDGYFISKDGTHTMIIINTPVKSTEISKSKKLIGYLKEKLNTLPDYIDAHIIGAHNHTISNAGTIKRDITINMLGIGIIFTVLIVFIFKDYRGLFIFLIPFLTFPAAILAVSAIHAEVSYFIIGFGAAIAGIGVDYGIHIYIARRSGKKKLDSVEKVARPLIIGAVTTITAFCAFYFSSITGYHQLATFSIVSLALCLVLSLFGLPHFLKTSTGDPFRYLRFSAEEFSPFFKTAVLLLWIGALLAFLWFFRGVTFQKSLKELDGTSSKIIREEREFRNTWLKWDRRAVLVVKGNTREEAMNNNRQIYNLLNSKIKKGEFLSPASFVPSKREQKTNVRNWNKFWTKDKVSAVKNRLLAEGEKYGFSSSAFSSFFNLIENDYTPPEDLTTNIPLLEKIEEMFTFREKGNYRIMSFLRDSEHNRKVLEEICSGTGTAYYISKNQISGQLREMLTSELLFLSTLVVVIVIIVVTLLLRSFLLIFNSLIPVFTAVCAVLAIMNINGMTPPAILALILVIGLTIDYGIFMVYQTIHDHKSGTRVAVTLSTFTTLGGAGILTLSDHPVLYQFGLTLAPGIVSGFIAACFVVPVLLTLSEKRGFIR